MNKKYKRNEVLRNLIEQKEQNNIAISGMYEEIPTEEIKDHLKWIYRSWYEAHNGRYYQSNDGVFTMDMVSEIFAEKKDEVLTLVECNFIILSENEEQVRIDIAG